MKITLKNVGIIKESTVIIDGITLITGRNNSGKSTFSKSVYALLSSSENLYNCATKDIVQYAESMLSNKFRSNALNILCRGALFSKDKLPDVSDERFLLLNDIYNKHYPEFDTLNNLEEYLESVIYNVDSIDESLIIRISENNTFSSRISEKIVFDLEKLKNSFINDIKDILGLIDKHRDFSEYEKLKLLYTLLVEFKGQISPVRINDILMSEFIINDNEDSYSFSVVEKEHRFFKTGDMLSSERNNVVFIDDVSVVDNIPLSIQSSNLYSKKEEIDFYIDIVDHKASLKRKISRKNSLAKTIVDDSNYSSIEKKINSIISDDIVIKDGKYVCSSDNLDLANLAMGSKLFAIIKMLLKNGSINSDTVLILDEPESHLHPEWQNILAEVVAILVKNFDLKVIITSHSPGFVLALQAFSIKYSLVDKTNFYKTRMIDDYLIEYVNVNNDLNSIYSDFALYYSKAKALFDSLINGEQDD